MFEVRNKIRETSEHRYPEIDIKDEYRFLCLKIAKSGYYGGDPDKVGEAPVGTVLDILNYESFLLDFMETDRCLNGST